jgi:hypothetical protein
VVVPALSVEFQGFSAAGLSEQGSGQIVPGDRGRRATDVRSSDCSKERVPSRALKRMEEATVTALAIE